MNTPIDRTVVQIHSWATTIAQIMGMHTGVDLRYVDHQRWECTQAAPEVWFAHIFLGTLLWAPEPWARTNGCVKLRVTNGLWIWKLTGETKVIEGVDGPLTMERGVWPD